MTNLSVGYWCLVPKADAPFPYRNRNRKPVNIEYAIAKVVEFKNNGCILGFLWESYRPKTRLYTWQWCISGLRNKTCPVDTKVFEFYTVSSKCLKKLTIASLLEAQSCEIVPYVMKKMRKEFPEYYAEIIRQLKASFK